MSKKQPVVVITGASSGIGRASALRFAATGARVVLASRRADALVALAAEIEALGGEAIAVPTDVTEEGAVQALGDIAVARFGRIDVWVNAASVAVYASFVDVPIEHLRRVLEVNVMGYVLGSRVALRTMIEQGSGTLVNVASVAGEIPMPYASSYSMAKAAVLSLGRTLQQELVLQKLTKVRVATILPATVDTPFFRHAANYTGRALRAMPPVYSPDLVAKAVVAAAARPRPEIVVGAAAKAFMAQHAAAPRVAEQQMAQLVDKVQLSRTTAAPDSPGNLYEPAPSADAEVAGGWGGKTRSAGRLLLGGLFLVASGTVLTRRLLRA